MDTKMTDKSVPRSRSISQDVANSDVYMADKRTICVQKVLFKMWDNRNEIDRVRELARLLSNFVEERRVFEDIEFYLPELLNLLVHLDMDSKAEDLEMLVMLICQGSMHTALQISFILSAYLEDYQPENADGKANPKCNPFYFKRVSRLLQNTERAVIYGSYVLSRAEEEAIRRLSLQQPQQQEQQQQQQQQQMQDMKKQQIAGAISRSSQSEDTYENDFDGVFENRLMFKRNKRKSSFYCKKWKHRHFVIDQRVLLCYREPHSVSPLRAISLQNCQIEVENSEKELRKYGNTCFNLVNYSSNVKLQLRAPDEASRTKYMDFLQVVINGAPQVTIGDGAAATTAAAAAVVQKKNKADDSSECPARKGRIHIIDESEMTAIEKKRFNYFKQLRIFITNMTNICERLRFKDRPMRKHFLKRDMHDLQIPPFAYLPLTRSTAAFSQILRALPSEGYAFNTKARCPALMLFEVERHPTGSDVATFLERELERFDDSDVIDHSIVIKYSTSGVLTDQEADAAADTQHEPEIRHRGSILGRNSIKADYNSSSSAAAAAMRSSGSDNDQRLSGIWKEEGDGLKRLRTITTVTVAATGNSTGSSQDEEELQERKENKGVVRGADEERSSSSSNNKGTALSAADVQVTLSDGEDEKEGEEGGVEGVASIFGETFEEKAARLQKQSPFGQLPGWHLSGLIAKSNDDLRQEVFVMQLIAYYKNAFAEANIGSWLYTYQILSTSQTTGLIELIPNSSSIDGLKKKKDYPGSLRKYFEQTYGYPQQQQQQQQQGKGDPPAFKAAVQRFVSSLASYSIVSYLLAIKDRHNGNIMIDKDGHVIHIDFGFVFGIAPGKAASMEKAEWKLTAEMVEVMGGLHSEYFQQYRQTCLDCLLVARKHAKQVKSLLEIMMFQSSFPSFCYNQNAVSDFEKRLFLDMPDQTIAKQVNRLIQHSYRHTGTYLYDQFQLATNGIAP